ncbi:hypothetical protein DFH09DRAFT_1068982 [Mycena vulgaris]|nr:hypothetical protein DFH09DRAFT_1068982 [Mycena vulgaris]
MFEIAVCTLQIYTSLDLFTLGGWVRKGVDLATSTFTSFMPYIIPPEVYPYPWFPARLQRAVSQSIYLCLIEHGASLPLTECGSCLKCYQKYFSLSTAGSLDSFKIQMMFDDLAQEFPSLDFTFNWVPFVDEQP